MIESEGYKAFRGTMKITPKCADREPFTEYADWLYKPEYDCWYGNGRSFMAEICEVVEDETIKPEYVTETLNKGKWVER